MSYIHGEAYVFRFKFGVSAIEALDDSNLVYTQASMMPVNSEFVKMNNYR
jgi:hypothetical protein